MKTTTLGASVALAAIAFASLCACGDIKSANGGEEAGAPSGDASAMTDAAAASENKGPGPHGSLPSGYCCNADSECRYRHCVDSGSGGKMCLDECEHDVFCTRPDITFTCEQSGSPSLCKPSAGFACLPAATFTRGTKSPGACCNAGSAATNDGTAGSDCEGNQCAAVGSGPLVCTHRCSFQSDCPGGFTCIQFGTSKACVPTTSSSTCL